MKIVDLFEKKWYNGSIIKQEVIGMTWRQRRSELVLKSFVSTLTEEEKAELEKINREHEEELFHEGIFQMLFD